MAVKTSKCHLAHSSTRVANFNCFMELVPVIFTAVWYREIKHMKYLLVVLKDLSAESLGQLLLRTSEVDQ